MKLPHAVLMALLLPSVVLGSDYAQGVDAIRHRDYAQARSLLQKAAERGHVFSQTTLGLLALTRSDRDPDPVQALGWLLAAQDNGARNLDSDIARARQQLAGAPDTDAKAYVARFGNEATRANWLPRKSDANFDPCAAAAGRADQAQVAEAQPWDHAEIAFVIYSRDGRLTDVLPVFRFPSDTTHIDAAYWIGQLVKRGKESRVRGSECASSGELVMRSSGPKSNKQEVLAALAKPADDGDPAALYVIGMAAILSGDERGVPLVEEAAQAGEPAAQFYVAKQLRNPQLARKWLELAAANGIPAAQLEIAESLLIAPDRAEHLRRVESLLASASLSDEESVLARIAAIRAAASDEQLRDPNAALKLAQRLDLRKWPFPLRYEAAALVSAARGDFKRAVTLQREAIERAQKLGYEVASLEERLEAFQAGRAWYGYLAQDYR